MKMRISWRKLLYSVLFAALVVGLSAHLSVFAADGGQPADGGERTVAASGEEAVFFGADLQGQGDTETSQIPVSPEKSEGTSENPAVTTEPAVGTEAEMTTEDGIQTGELVQIVFDANGARGDLPEEIQASLTDQIRIPEGASLTKNGFFFLGWSLDPSADVAAYYPGTTLEASRLAGAAGEDGQNPKDIITLYGVWIPVQDHTVTYINGEEEQTETVETGQYPAAVPEVIPQERPFLGWEDENGTIVDPGTVQIMKDTVFTASYGVLLNTQDHDIYMNGNTEGCFQPEEALSRAEAAQLLYSLIEEKGEADVSFSDVPEDMWYAEAINTMASMHLISGYGDTFEPDKKISRAEFITLLSRFFPLEESKKTFSDVPADHWALAAIASAAEKGWSSGYPDGTFRPDQSISRAETAVLMNRVLGRTPDRVMIDSSAKSRIFLDLSPDHWAYYDIMEASTGHEYVKNESGAETWTYMEEEKTNLSPGFYNVNGNLYLVKQDTGEFARNETVGNFTFDRYGRYTTGDAALDQYIVGILAQITTKDMTQEQKLRAAYNYVRDNYSYLKRPLISSGQTGWENSYALEMLQLGKGNCYSFAATFYHLSKALGYDNNTVVGVVGTRRSPHGWVEIRMDGGLYLFDTELEMAYRAKGNYSYNLYKMTYGYTPFIYIKS